MQADIQAHIEQQQQKKIDAVMDIINRWNTWPQGMSVVVLIIKGISTSYQPNETFYW